MSAPERPPRVPLWKVGWYNDVYEQCVDVDQYGFTPRHAKSDEEYDTLIVKLRNPGSFRQYKKMNYYHRVLEGADVPELLEDDDDIDSQIQLITPSRFLTWFHQETMGSHLDEDIQHYRIACWDFCVDVLAAQPPDVCINKE